MRLHRTRRMVFGGLVLLGGVATGVALASSPDEALLIQTPSGEVAFCEAGDRWLTLSSKMVDGAGTFASTVDQAIEDELSRLGVPRAAAASVQIESLGAGVYAVNVPDSQTVAAAFTVSEINGTYVVTGSQMCDGFKAIAEALP